MLSHTPAHVFEYARNVDPHWIAETKFYALHIWSHMRILICGMNLQKSLLKTGSRI